MADQRRWDMPTRLSQSGERDPLSTARSSHSELESVAEGVLVGGRYRLVRKIGQGGMGAVWEAEHLGLRSLVAIKFLSLSVEADPTQAVELLERFRFESQISARLATLTSNVVTVHDSGLHEGSPYLVMELARGESLESWIDRERILPEALIAVLEQIGQALDAAHLSGIVHRDVKPGNVLCVSAPGEDRRYKLADFGVAKLFDPTAVGKLTPPKQTNVHSLIGSPAYMSPEYVGGASIIDGALDLWALAVLAYEALTRSVPFDGDDASRVLAQILRCEIAAPSTIVPSLGPAIDAFFERALARDPKARFANAAEFARTFALAARSTEAIAASSRHTTQVSLRQLPSDPNISQATSIAPSADRPSLPLDVKSIPPAGASPVGSVPALGSVPPPGSVPPATFRSAGPPSMQGGEAERTSQEVEALIGHDTLRGDDPSRSGRVRRTVATLMMTGLVLLAIGSASFVMRSGGVSIRAANALASVRAQAKLLMEAPPAPSVVPPEPPPTVIPSPSPSVSSRVRAAQPVRSKRPHTFDKSEQP